MRRLATRGIHPEGGSIMSRTRLPLVAAVFGLVAVALLATDTSVQASSNSSQLSVANFVEVGGTKVKEGASTLLRHPDGIELTVRTSGLKKKHAFTVWTVIFNNPSACAGSPCSMSDGGNPAVGFSVVWVTGFVTGKGDVVNVGAHLEEGLENAPGVVVTGLALTDAEGAEIHVVVRDHGKTIKGSVDAQISQINGGCPPNDCGNVQVAIHQ